jgi:hypothetical protein
MLLRIVNANFRLGTPQAARRLAALARDTGFAPSEAVTAGLVRGGLIARSGSSVHLVGDGWPLADGVVTRLVGALYPVPSSGDAGLEQRVT